MTVEEMSEFLEMRVAPVKLSDDFCAKYKMYDNSGIIINCGEKVKGALFSLDLSEAAVKLAISRGYNLIVTHHPAVYGGVSRFDLTGCAQSRALAACLKNDISVISMHLNFDAAPNGIDYFLMKGLGGGECEILAPVEGGGYGRAYDIAPVTLGKFIEKIKTAFQTERLICHGESEYSETQVRKVASFCGAGCDDNAINFAKRNNADVFVSSDLKHHQIAELAESGITVIQLTHYASESYGFKRIYEDIENELKVKSEFFFDERFA